MNALRTPLRVARLRLDGTAAADARPDVLGVLGYGAASDAQRPGLHSVCATPLLNQGTQGDVWTTAAPVFEGRTGCVRWRAGGGWLFGAAELGIHDEAQGLEALAQRAYADLFATLRAHGQPPLLRLWNYLPRITGASADGGMERYRQFNIGRQRAFLDAGQAAFDGAPAACALGLCGEGGEGGEGGLSLCFIAGHTEVRAVENPRQVSAYRYPAQYGPRAPTFSRAALAPLGGGTLALLVSGTASIVGHESLHVGDTLAHTLAQLDETLRNLQAVFAAARAQCDAPFALADSAPVIYVRHADEAGAIRARLAQALGADSRFMREAVYLEAEVCRADLRVEIETLACAPGELRAP